MLAGSWRDAVLGYSIVLDVWLQPMFFPSPYLVVPPRLFLVVSSNQPAKPPAAKSRMSNPSINALNSTYESPFFFSVRSLSCLSEQLDCIFERKP